MFRFGLYDMAARRRQLMPFQPPLSPTGKPDRILWWPADSNECRFGYHCRRNCCNLQRGGGNKLISYSLYNFILNPSMAVSSILLQQEAPGGAVCSSMETMPLEGKMAPHGGDVCAMCVSLAKSLPSGSFSFPPNALKCSPVDSWVVYGLVMHFVYECPKRLACFGSSTRFRKRKVVGK